MVSRCGVEHARSGPVVDKGPTINQSTNQSIYQPIDLPKLINRATNRPTCRSTDHGDIGEHVKLIDITNVVRVNTALKA